MPTPANGVKSSCDIAEIKRFAILCYPPGSVIELRAPKTRQKTQSGYFSDVDKLAQAAASLSGQCPGVYTTLNEVKPEVLARSSNRLTPYCEITTADKDIISRHKLPIDLDADRPAGISSNDTEHQAALAKARECAAYLIKLGFPKDSIIIGDSGNGGHVLVQIDLPNTPESTALIQQCLKALAHKFSDDVVKVDQTTYNAARIWKLYGTLAAKGDPTPERPHRIARIISAPQILTIAPREALERLAATLPTELLKVAAPRQNFDVLAWLQRHGVEIVRSEPYQGGTRHILGHCVFNPEHTGSSAAIFHGADGIIGFKCHHNSCSDKAWHDVRELFEPGYKSRWQGSSEPSDDGFHLTDLGNAQRLVRLCGDRLHFSYERKKWLVWGGTVWQWDEGAKITAAAKETVRKIYHEAGSEVDERVRKAIAAHAERCESDHRIQAMINLAESEPGIPVSLADLDRHPYLYNCLNGTLDLKSGQLLPHRKEDLLTILVPIAYDPDAECPLWLRFLGRVTGKDKKLMEYLQRAVGYSLTGETKEQLFFFLYGLGNNGKSTFVIIIRRLTGDYGQRVSTDLFMLRDRSAGGPKEGLANLWGKRFVVGSEVEDGRRLAVGLIKDLCGGETIRADKKYEHELEFQPTHKLWMVGNHRPEIHDTTLSIWRRLKLVPFTVTIPDKEVDPDLSSKLEKELPGILNWAVKGCLDWQRYGLGEPDAVLSATANYRQDQDILGEFIDGACVLAPTAEIRKKDLRALYSEWCLENNLEEVTQKTFRARLIERGIQDGKGTAGVRLWRGIREKTSADLVAESGKTDGGLNVSGNKGQESTGNLHIKENLEKFTENPATNATDATKPADILEVT